MTAEQGTWTPPRIGVVICGCGGEISEKINVEALRQQVCEMPDIVYAACEPYPCSPDGQARLQRAIVDHHLERIVIAGCAPRLVGKLFRSAASAVELDESAIEIIDIREGCAFVHPPESQATQQKAADLIKMGVARMSAITAQHLHTFPLCQSALVIGSGLEGLTVATSLADNELPVILIEAAPKLGGELLPLQTNGQALADEYMEAMPQHPLIQTMLNARVSGVAGRPGNYRVTVSQNSHNTALNVGAILVTPSALPTSRPPELWSQDKRVRTQLEFAIELAEATTSGHSLPYKSIVFILYSKAEAEGRCTPLQCTSCLRQAAQAKQLNPNAEVTILFRDLNLGIAGGSGEDIFRQAKALGVNLFRYHQGRPPIVGDGMIAVPDSLTGEAVQFPFDRVVLALPLAPSEQNTSLAKLLHLPQDKDGFLFDPRHRLRPERYTDDGIYLLGSAHRPVDTAESLFQAYLTGARAARFLRQDVINTGAPVAAINADLCTGCGACIQVCPEAAIHLVTTNRILSLAEVEPLLCTGCGNCVVTCPPKAITVPGWEDLGILGQISAALESPRLRQKKNGVSSPAPRILVLTCEWSAFAAAEIAGARHLPFSPDIRIIPLNCAARIDPLHILWAFLNGADGVFVGTCLPGQCHFGSGVKVAQERLFTLREQLAAIGIDPQRLHLGQLAGDDSAGFVEGITNFIHRLKHLKPLLEPLPA
jgi:heterodisulfide reductase subunit A